MFRPKLPTYSKLEKYISSIDASRHYSNFGPLESEVRSRFSNYLGLPQENIVLCANATLGIEGAISTSNSTGLWGLPSWTFTATAAALNQSVGTGIFLDINSDWRVEPNHLCQNLIDVLPFGQPIGDPSRYQSFGMKKIVIDAAASFDSCAGQSWNSFPPVAGVLSFHATKVLPAAEGGLFFSNSAEWAEDFRSWTKFGMKSKRISVNSGTNAKLSEYHSAVLLASMDTWDSDRELWLTQLSRANDLARKFGYASNPQLSEKYAIPYWIVQHKDIEAIRTLRQSFAEQSIETRDWWESGCHQMSAYNHFLRQDLSMTNQVAQETLGLPFWIDMDNDVWEAIERAFQRADSK